MLQQTQAGRVVAYYTRFLRLFPTASALAEATLAEVLDAWSGLGYNTRAERLRRACRSVTADGWPRAADGLLELPGVGPYTAAAVASLAFGQPVAAVDTNVRRVISRWVGEPLNGARLTKVAAAELDGNAAEWNQAVMELGAQLCTPRAPACSECPVAPWCCGPDVYVPPTRQASFAGSRRQARGAVIRALTIGPSSDLDTLVANTGLDPARVREALHVLQADGMIAEEADRYVVAD